MIDFIFKLIEKKVNDLKTEKQLTKKEKEMFSNWLKKQENIPQKLIDRIHDKKKDAKYEYTELDNLIIHEWAVKKSKESAKKINW